ncbi:hypothetical protein [Tautonia rosea]|uniref:hypothetical protein n=1 Tax=Tautonia rosea TaxID=2728037 RepID=UPI001472ACE9|nr:hypothetical protein [Tautonia rosea]
MPTHPTPPPTPSEIVTHADSSAPWWTRPLPWLELFAAGNFAFLALDIFMAHSMNRFAEASEWIPFLFSLAAPPVLVVCWLLQGRLRPYLSTDPIADGPPGWRRWLARWLGHLVGALAIVVGVAGMLLHLQSHFFESQTIHNLVYTAPFAAPLAYAGLGLLVILNRTEHAPSLEWARWVVLLAMGGFLGNFVLCLADHAQNGFFYSSEWIGVISAAYAVGALFAVATFPTSRLTWRFAAVVMITQVIVGLVGFLFHLIPNLRSPMPTFWESFVYGAPIFAPLLFADLAILATFGLWAIALACPEVLSRSATSPSPEIAPS